MVPVTIRYGDRRVYWADKSPMKQHLVERLLPGPPVQAVVHIGEAIASRGYDNAEALGEAVHAAVCQPIVELGELVR